MQTTFHFISWNGAMPAELGLQLYLLFLSVLLGLIFGSFCNAWAWRLAHGESIARGRSHCAVCGHTLAARDLVPLVSYLILKGRCRYCGSPIAKRYPMAELLSACFFASCFVRFGWGEPPLLARFLIVGCLLLVAALADLETFEIPDRLLAGIALAFIVFVPFSGGWEAVKSGLIGACAVSVPLLLFVLLADRVAGRETMGGADIKLFFVLGLHFGAARTLLLLIVSCLFGVLFALSSRAGRQKAIPFGPAIAAAAWFVMLFGDSLLAWYLGLFAL